VLIVQVQEYSCINSRSRKIEIIILSNTRNYRRNFTWVKNGK